MKEKHGGIWCDVPQDSSGTVVFESYSKEADRLFKIFERSDGFYTPYVYEKSTDPQYILPLWIEKNSKVIMSTMDEAKKYLNIYGLIIT